MFIGHFGLALMVKSKFKQVSLGALFLATECLDLIWSIFMILGLEKVKIDPGASLMMPVDLYNIPYSHSLVAALFWSFVAGACYLLSKKNLQSSLVISALVISHWFLDALVHVPDLPLTLNGSLFVGLGLWNSYIGTVAIELALVGVGLYLYLRSTRAIDRWGKFFVAALLIILALTYAPQLLRMVPQSETELAISSLGLWIFVALGCGLESKRENI